MVKPPPEGTPERAKQQGDGKEITRYMTIIGADGKPLFKGKESTFQPDGEIVGIATGEDYVPPPEPKEEE